MKKSKVILAIALAVVLIITCMNVPTFSWFTRPKSKSGESMVLQSKNSYTAYNGKDVKMETKISEDGGVTYETSTTNYSGTGINPYTRKYFCTTITNTSGTEQNVSLYASKLSIPTTSSNGTLALGVNGPTRSYRNYSELAKQSLKTSRNYMRVYFENDYNVEGWTDKDKWYYICWNDDPNTGSESLDGTGTNGNFYKLEKIKDCYYYADIPSTATHAFFSVQDFGTNNNGNANWGQRTQTLWNLASDELSPQKSVLFKLTNNYKGDNPQVEAIKTIHGANISGYYSTISVAKGSTFNASLATGDGIGNIDYYSGDESVFTVDNTGSTKGTIRPVAAGEAILYTKTTGPSYGDTLQVETIVKVTASANYEFNDVPIVRNIKIPAAVSDDPTKNVVNVYWYVINNSNSKKLEYAIDDIYLGL